MNPMQSVFLVGLKHVGKSTLAGIAANTLEIVPLDLDTMIVELTGNCASPREVYRRYGPNRFIELEARATERAIEFSRAEDAIIATGGGIADNEVALRAIRTSRVPVLYLFEEPLVLYDRVRAGGIPAFLDTTRPREHFLELAESRDRVYRSIAASVVILTGYSISEAATQLIEEIRRINVR